MFYAVILIYINIINFVLVNLGKDYDMIQTDQLKDNLIFFQTIITFVLSTKK